jgi:carbon-monoxide dehydrogenase medium subunit
MLQPFTYVAPREKQELLGVLAEKGAEARLLAGGTDLLVDLRTNPRGPRWVVDIKRIPEMRRVGFDPAEGLSVGAAATVADLLLHPVVQQRYPVLCAAALNLGSPQLRNRATVVGNICTASPCADMGTALLCHDAVVCLESATGKRTLPLKEFFIHVKKTALQPGEVVTRVVVPPAAGGGKGGMLKLKRIKGHDLALASVVLLRVDSTIRVSVGSCAPTPVCTVPVPADSPVEKVVEAVRQVIKPIDDLRASAEYRTFIVGEYTAQLTRQVQA